MKPLIALSASLALCASTSADVLLSTDFAGRTVEAAPSLTVTDIVWTTLGLEDPGDLTAISEPPGTIPMMFDTAAAQGHFAPDRNVGNEGPWSVDVPLVIEAGVGSVTLESVELDWQHFNNAGALQGPSRNVDWTVKVTGSLSGLVPGSTVTAENIAGTSGVETLTFDPPLLLPAGETYQLNVNATGSNTTGNNTGLDGLTVNGTVGPPSGTGFAITEFSLDGDVITVTWPSREGAPYILRFSPDLIDWTGDLDDSLEGAAGDETTVVIDLGDFGIDIAETPQLFFRIEPGPG